MYTLARCQFVDVVEHVRVKNKTHVLQTRDLVTKQGGEGLMLRRPQSKYAATRSNDLLKVSVLSVVHQTMLSSTTAVMHVHESACCVLLT